MAAVFATACVVGGEGVDGIDGDGADEEELQEVVEEPPATPELPAAREPDVVTSPQRLQLADDPDEGGQVKRAANRDVRNTATR